MKNRDRKGKKRDVFQYIYEVTCWLPRGVDGRGTSSWMIGSPSYPSSLLDDRASALASLKTSISIEETVEEKKGKKAERSMRKADDEEGEMEKAYEGEFRVQIDSR